MGTPGKNPGALLYSNLLTGPEDVADWIAEGPVSLARHPETGTHPETDDDGGTAPAAGSPSGALLLSGSKDDEEFGDHAHWTFWCPVEFPDRVRVRWEFLPIAEPGLAMVFFSATGHGGLDLFSEDLAPRTGYYPQYHSGDVDALHVSYFRHKYAAERAFRTCNLRKSAGFELVAQAADPLPPAEDALDFFRMELVKDGPDVGFAINGLPVLAWRDESGSVLGGGYLGFRQMAPLQAAYRNLTVEAL